MYHVPFAFYYMHGIWIFSFPPIRFIQIIMILVIHKRFLNQTQIMHVLPIDLSMAQTLFCIR